MMAEAEGEASPSEEQQNQLRASTSGPGDNQPAARTECTEEPAAAGGAPRSPPCAFPAELAPDLFKFRKFFVLRVKTFNISTCRTATLCCHERRQFTCFRNSASHYESSRFKMNKIK